MNLQEQIAEFEANGCIAGGRKWERSYDDTIYREYETTLANFLVVVAHYSTGKYELQVANCEQDLTSTTLESALCEALDIVKAKVMDLVKELGFVCFNKAQMSLIHSLLTKERHNFTNRKESGLATDSELELLTKYHSLQKYMNETRNEILAKQYIEGQDNEI